MSRNTSPPTDRFCDLVMKGGITSGVVYPLAIWELACHYRFRSIGGTSAGAIAAVVTAAAEYQRRQTGSDAGFRKIAKLPFELQEEVAPRTSRLLSLFQPARTTRRLFSVLIASLNSKSTKARMANTLFGFIRAYWPAGLAAVVVSAAILWLGQGWLAALLALLVSLVVFIGAWAYRDITRKVVDNNFGLCKGMGGSDDQPALAPWLHDLIQTCAGRTSADDPLTFGDLWRAEGFPPSWLRVADPAKVRSIDLQMFTTNLTHGRPYIFPLPQIDDRGSRFPVRERLYFRPEELKDYLPERILAWMVENSQPYVLDPARAGKDPPTEKGTGLRELPASRDLPVLLAARMSLSFPLLFSAVPLYAIDHEKPSDREFVRCWFSDGGISSNFPMHLFDGLIPMWPTFGIDLEPKIEGRDLVFLPDQYKDGYGERISRATEDPRPAGRLGGFLSAIVGAMQNWNDVMLSRMPGVRDRVVRVRLDTHEGGMNLNMEAEVIEGVAARGRAAGRKLVQRFATTVPGGGQSQGWDEHRFVRLCTLLETVSERIPSIWNALDPRARHVTALHDLLQRMQSTTDPDGRPQAPPGFEAPITVDQREALLQAIDALGRFATAFGPEVERVPFKPIPNPELRVRPPL